MPAPASTARLSSRLPARAIVALCDLATLLAADARASSHPRAAQLFLVSRFFYDCLNHWTGAEPAEYFSCRKRKKYRDYQRTVRVFWPFELPIVDHGRMPGWPTGSLE